MPIPAWLREDLALTDAEVSTLDPILTDARVTALNAGHTRQADYSRAMNDLKTQQEQLALAQENLETQIAEWGRSEQDGIAVTKKMREDLAAAEARVLRLTQTVRQIAMDAGQDPEKALEGITVPPTTPSAGTPPVGAPDLTGFARTADVAGLAQMMLTLPAELAAIQHEHHQLTGEWLDTRAIVQEIQTRAANPRNKLTLNPRDIWESTHQIADKRQAAETKRLDDLKAAEYERGRQSVLSEVHANGGQPPPSLLQRGASPVLHRPDGAQRPSALARPQPGSRYSGAVTALRSGKYRSDGAQQKTA